MKPTHLAFLLFFFTILTHIYAYTPVTVPNGSKLAYTMVKGVKEFHLTLEEIDHEFAPGLHVKTWGYNGQTPGPVIETVEGDHVRILVTNKLKEPTAIHWYGLFVPNGMDGVQGLTQQGIPVGATFAYEFMIKQHGTFMYASSGSSMTETNTLAMGFLIAHPEVETHRIDKDFVIFLNDWVASANNTRQNNLPLTTFNSKIYPATDPLVIQTGERVRIRFANVGQAAQPIHLHGYSFKSVATNGGDIPVMSQWPETTVIVGQGQSRDIEFLANAPGDWALESQRRNTHVAGEGPFGKIETGGMFTILKVREKTNNKTKESWYTHPKGSVSESIPVPK